MARRSLLRQITEQPLSKSCDVPWSAMTGGARVRVCAECEREVWNLSAMTAREAEIRLLNAATLPCINYRVDEDGRLESRAEPRPPAPRRMLFGAAAFAATTLVAPGAGSIGGAAARAEEKAPDKSPDKSTDKSPEKPKPAPAPTAKKAKTDSKKFKTDDCPVYATNEPNAAAAAPAAGSAPPAAAPSAPAPAAPPMPGAAAMNPARPPEPRALGGAPPRIQEPPAVGTVQVKSATPRDLVIDGIAFHAPVSVRLPPGKHEATIKSGDKTVKRSFMLRVDATYVLDLDP